MNISDHDTMKLEVNHKFSKKNCKGHKYTEVKQHATKQWMGQPGNKKGGKRIDGRKLK